MVNITGSDGRALVEQELNAILHSNQRGFAGLCIKRVSISDGPSVSVTMMSLKRQDKVFLDEKAQLFRELLGNRVLARRIQVVFTGDSFL